GCRGASSDDLGGRLGDLVRERDREGTEEVLESSVHHPIVCIVHITRSPSPLVSDESRDSMCETRAGGEGAHRVARGFSRALGAPDSRRVASPSSTSSRSCSLPTANQPAPPPPDPSRSARPDPTTPP